jgi:hypothetical protein
LSGAIVAESRLQNPFLRELADTFKATEARILRRFASIAFSDAAGRAAILTDELRGLYHGVLVTFDGGTALANEGLISIVDEDGLPFIRHLHELCFRYWPTEEDSPAT